MGDQATRVGENLSPKISIIVPLRNEAKQLPALLEHLQHWRERDCEVLLVDGDSSDASVAIATAAGWSPLRVPPGRARQMNAGAKVASGDLLVFLHADTRLPADADKHLYKALQRYRWGRFNVVIEGQPRMLGVIAFCMNWRSRLSGIATGDQALFVDAALFRAIGGFADQPLMEDVELCRRLKVEAAPCCLHARVTTSGRRWLAAGIWPTIWLMWRLRWAYWRGESAVKLARSYR